MFRARRKKLYAECGEVEVLQDFNLQTEVTAFMPMLLDVCVEGLCRYVWAVNRTWRSGRFMGCQRKRNWLKLMNPRLEVHKNSVYLEWAEGGGLLSLAGH